MGYDDLYYRQEVGPLAIWTGDAVAGKQTEVFKECCDF